MADGQMAPCRLAVAAFGAEGFREPGVAVEDVGPDGPRECGRRGWEGEGHSSLIFLALVVGRGDGSEFVGGRSKEDRRRSGDDGLLCGRWRRLRMV